MLGWLKGTQETKKKNNPVAEWMGVVERAFPYTPDSWVLNQYQYQLVFVYGRHQRGHPEHDLVQTLGGFVATTYTDDKMFLWRREMGRESFPILIEQSEMLPIWHKPDWAQASKTRVQGELYAVPSKTLITLDNHYFNTVQFNRKRVQLMIPYRNLYQVPGGTALQKYLQERTGAPCPPKTVISNTEVKLVKAWVYIGEPMYWKDQLPGFFGPADLYQSRVGWLGDYQAFTPGCYDPKPRVKPEPAFDWTKYEAPPKRESQLTFWNKDEEAA